MGLFDRNAESEAEVESARTKVSLAVLKMTEVLDKVQSAATQTKEELSARRPG